MTYLRLVAKAAQYNYPTLGGTAPVGNVYFYCKTSNGGSFRAIHQIIYGGYNSGVLAFQGTFQYYLQNANKIHYTINGQLYRGTTNTSTVGGSVGIGESASINASVGSTSNYYGPIYYHGNRNY